jgi:hypothetical protein
MFLKEKEIKKIANSFIFFLNSNSSLHPSSSSNPSSSPKPKSSSKLGTDPDI